MTSNLDSRIWHQVFTSILNFNFWLRVLTSWHDSMTWLHGLTPRLDSMFMDSMFWHGLLEVMTPSHTTKLWLQVLTPWIDAMTWLHDLTPYLWLGLTPRNDSYLLTPSYDSMNWLQVKYMVWLDVMTPDLDSKSWPQVLTSNLDFNSCLQSLTLVFDPNLTSSINFKAWLHTNLKITSFASNSSWPSLSVQSDAHIIVLASVLRRKASTSTQTGLDHQRDCTNTHFLELRLIPVPTLPAIVTQPRKKYSYTKTRPRGKWVHPEGWRSCKPSRLCWFWQRFLQCRRKRHRDLRPAIIWSEVWTMSWWVFDIAHGLKIDFGQLAVGSGVVADCVIRVPGQEPWLDSSVPGADDQLPADGGPLRDEKGEIFVWKRWEMKIKILHFNVWLTLLQDKISFQYIN